MPSRGPKVGPNGYITPALSEVPEKGGKIRLGYITHPFSKAKNWAERLHNPCSLSGVPRKGDKMKSGYITPIFSRAKNWAQWQQNAYSLGGPEQGGHNQKRLHNAYFLGA